MSSSHTFLRYTRLVHLYIGVFIAPALLFFAFTGALQTFSLHETTRGSSYKPPAWIVMLSQIHKKQTPIVPARRLPPPEKATDKPVADKSQAATQPPPNAVPRTAEMPSPKPTTPCP